MYTDEYSYRVTHSLDGVGVYSGNHRRPVVFGVAREAGWMGGGQWEGGYWVYGHTGSGVGGQLDWL